MSILEPYKTKWSETPSSQRLHLFARICAVYALLTQYDSFLLSNFGHEELVYRTKIFFFLTGPLSEGVLELIRWAWPVSLILFIAGWVPNFLSKVVFGLALFVYGYCFHFVEIFHGSHLFVMVLGLLAFTKIKPNSFGAMLSPWTLPQGVGMIKAYTVFMWVTLGLQKLFYGGAEWVFSDSFANYIFLTPGVSSDLVQWVMDYPMVFRGLAGAGVALELFSLLPLISRRAALWMPVLWVCFHFQVSFFFGDHMVFYSQFVVYLVFWFFPEPLFKDIIQSEIFKRSTRSVVQ